MAVAICAATSAHFGHILKIIKYKTTLQLDCLQHIELPSE